jgi:hypothetical protein
MSILKSMTTRVEKQKSFIITVYGAEAVGKTTFASTFPKPLFIRAEKGLKNQGIDTTPILKKLDDVIKVLTGLINEDHEYKSVVIDSISAVDLLIRQQIMDEDPAKPKTFESSAGGFGAPGKKAYEKHKQIHDLCSRLVDEKGMWVIYLAHMTNESMVHAGFSENYLCATIDVTKQARPVYTYFSDLVAKISVPFSVSDERARNGDTGERIFSCMKSENSASKNTIGIKEEIRFKDGENPLFMYFIKKREAEKKALEEIKKEEDKNVTNKE